MKKGRREGRPFDRYVRLEPLASGPASAAIFVGHAEQDAQIDRRADGAGAVCALLRVPERVRYAQSCGAEARARWRFRHALTIQRALLAEQPAVECRHRIERVGGVDLGERRVTSGGDLVDHEWSFPESVRCGSGWLFIVTSPDGGRSDADDVDGSHPDRERSRRGGVPRQGSMRPRRQAGVKRRVRVSGTDRRSGDTRHRPAGAAPEQGEALLELHHRGTAEMILEFFRPPLQPNAKPPDM